MLNTLLEKLFRISEIRDSKILQIAALCFFMVFIVTFSYWVNGEGSNMTCSPHITHCEFYKSILIFEGFPYSYDQSIFYIILLGVIFIGLYALYVGEYTIVWASLFLLALYKGLYIYAFSAGNYDYYDIVLVSFFLFAHNKLYWLRIGYVLLYFLAATIKLHPGWILGTYFSAMQLGIPLFPEISTALWTNMAIVAQIVLCWGLLLRKHTIIFILAEIFFFSFHFYSGILVEYRYLLSTIPLMIVLFVIPREIVYKRSYNIFSYFFIGLLFLGQSIAILIPGDQKLTLEGNEYGLYMFEANHQCISTYNMVDISGSPKETIHTSKMARDRCDPYDAVMRYEQLCQTQKTPISLKFDHSINGGPFYRIVDTPDVCKLQYIPFARNTWIKSEYDSPELIGYPVKNFYDGRIRMKTSVPTMSGSTIRLPGLEHTDPISMNRLQQILSPYVGSITIGYWILWGIMLILMIVLHIREIGSLNKKSHHTIDLVSR